MNQLQVYLLGEFVVQYKDKQPVCFTTNKEAELFCYLLLKRSRSHSREAVASLLWGDTTTDRSKKYLRTALWQLRSDLKGPAAGGVDPLITTAQGWIQLCPRADIWTDAMLLEHAYAHVRDVSGEQLDAGQAEVLREAVVLYRGQLLEGWYQDWCLYERERFKHIYFNLVDKLMVYYEAHHDFDQALSLGLRMLNEEPARETTHRRLMRLYYRTGNRCAALRQYHRCEATLREELDISPSSLTQSLYEQLRTDRLDDPAPPPVASQPPATVATLRHLLDSLTQLQTTLTAVRQQLQQEIEQPQHAVQESPMLVEE